MNSLLESSLYHSDTDRERERERDREKEKEQKKRKKQTKKKEIRVGKIERKKEMDKEGKG